MLTERTNSFGIPASFKRYLQDEALEQFGDNMAKDYLKKGLDKIPDSDRPEVQKMRNQVKGKIPANVGDIQNSLGGLVSGYGRWSTEFC